MVGIFRGVERELGVSGKWRASNGARTEGQWEDVGEVGNGEPQGLRNGGCWMARKCLLFSQK